jgi:hypothetical protein
MAGRGVLAALAALMVAGCSGGDEHPVGCAGAAVIITATLLPAPVSDGGTDAEAGADAGVDAAADGGGGDAKPACTGSCLEYLEALRVAVEAATPAACVRLTYGTSLACVPSPNSPEGCPGNTVDETRALQAQISAYLSASWPEIDTPAAHDTCRCHID